MPKMEEEQAINLIVKHFPISIQPYIQNCAEKMYTHIEKLGEIESRGRNETKPKCETEKRRFDFRTEGKKTEI